MIEHEPESHEHEPESQDLQGTKEDYPPPEDTGPIEVIINRVEHLLFDVEADPQIRELMGTRDPLPAEPALARRIARLQAATVPSETMASLADGLAACVRTAAKARGIEQPVSVMAASRSLAEQGGIGAQTADALGDLYEMTSDNRLRGTRFDSPQIDFRSLESIKTHGTQVLGAIGALGAPI